MGIDHLQLVVHHNLQNIPLALLMSGEKKYLVDEFSMAFSHSFQMTHLEYNNLQEANVRGFGVSDFSDHREKAIDPNPNMTDLLGVNQELQAVNNTEHDIIPEESLLTRANLQRYLEQEAAVAEVWKNADSIDNLMEALGIAREGLMTIEEFLKARYSIETAGQILHLATHGEFSFGAGYVVTPTTLLTLADILTFDFKELELVILRACRTGLGNQYNERGVAGAALTKGAESVLGSLWYINDVGTTAMVTAFYEVLEEMGLPKAQLLQQAQIAMKNGWITFENGYLVYKPDGDEERTVRSQLSPELAAMGDWIFTHPYYWSGFEMYGSGH